MNEQVIAGLLVGGVFGAILLGVLIFYVIEIIGSWKIMKKFGEPGWKAIIPFYNVFVEFKYTWNKHMMWVLFGLMIIGEVMYEMEGAAGVIGCILVIAAAVVYIIGQHKLSKAFGHGAGFTVGLVLLPGIFTIILGFGKSEYKKTEIIAE